MIIFYWISVILSWVVYTIVWYFDAPWWIDYPTFGLASVVTGLVLVFLLILSNKDGFGPRF